MVGASSVFVTLDSDHQKYHVLEELYAYAPLVPVGSWILVQDTRLSYDWASHYYSGLETAMDLHYAGAMLGNGPREAVDAFLEDPRWKGKFVVDRSYERLFISNHLRGWLRRVA